MNSSKLLRAFAAEKKPDLICDVATLTGAAYVALGVDIGAVISNSEKYAAEFIKSNKNRSQNTIQVKNAPRYLQEAPGCLQEVPRSLQ